MKRLKILFWITGLIIFFGVYIRVYQNLFGVSNTSSILLAKWSILLLLVGVIYVEIEFIDTSKRKANYLKVRE